MTHEELTEFLFGPYSDEDSVSESFLDENTEYVDEASNIKNNKNPKHGEIWKIRMPFLNFKNPYQKNIGMKVRRCLILDDPDLGKIAVRCSSLPNATNNKSKDKGTHKYDYPLKNTPTNIFPNPTYLAANDFKPLKYCTIYQYIGKLTGVDYKESIATFERFKKDRYKSLINLMEWMVGSGLCSYKTAPNNLCLKSIKEIETSKHVTSLDVCTLFKYVAKKFSIYHHIIHASLDNRDYFYPIYSENRIYKVFRFIPQYPSHGLIFDTKNKSIDGAIQAESIFLKNYLHLKNIPSNTKLYHDYNYWYNAVSNNMKQKDFIDILKTNYEPLYFYHLAPEDADISKGLLSPYAAYKAGDKQLVVAMLDKYRNRAVNQWKYYPDRDPESLTIEELLNSLNKVRGKDGDKCIYFFKYPPYPELGTNTKKSLEKYHTPYRIDINNPELKKHIIRIDWGWPESDFTKPSLTKDYYVNVSKKDYFSKYTDNPKPGQPLFAALSHISIAFKDGVCPKQFLEKVDPKMNIQEAYDRVKDILKQQKDSTDCYMQSVAETVNSISKDSNIFFSEKDIYCNFWPFEQKKTHFCFVVGFSGSGKTTLARHLAKRYDAEWVELDTIMYDSKLHKMTERFLTNQKQRLLAKYIRENNVDLSHMANIDRTHPSHEDIALMIETGRAFVEWLTTKNTERCVISGLDLIDIIPTNPAWYGAPIVFKGTSRLHSMYRRLERNRSSVKKTIEMVPQLISWYKSDAHGIDYIRSMTINEYNYQERDELGELKKIKPSNISSHHSMR